MANFTYSRCQRHNDEKKIMKLMTTFLLVVIVIYSYLSQFILSRPSLSVEQSFSSFFYSRASIINHILSTGNMEGMENDDSSAAVTFPSEDDRSCVSETPALDCFGVGVPPASPQASLAPGELELDSSLSQVSLEESLLPCVTDRRSTLLSDISIRHHRRVYFPRGFQGTFRAWTSPSLHPRQSS